MKSWRIEYESINSGFRECTVEADRNSIDDNMLIFWDNLTPVAMFNTMNLVSCIELARGRVRGVPVINPENADPAFTDRLRMRYSHDPIGDAAREAAKRFEPKVTSSPNRWLTSTEPTRGELGNGCA